MRHLQPGAYLQQDAPGFGKGHPPIPGQTVLQRAARHIFHGDIKAPAVLLHRIHTDQVGVAKAGRNLRFQAKTLQEIDIRRHVGMQHFKRHKPVQGAVLRPVNCAKPSLANGF